MRKKLRTFQLMFFFNDTATTEIYTLSLHDALPISPETVEWTAAQNARTRAVLDTLPNRSGLHRRLEALRSEEHTSELQSRQYLVCRLLLEKKNQNRTEDNDSELNYILNVDTYTPHN